MFSKLYLRGAMGCVIVNDITRPESLRSALRWKDMVHNCFEEDQNRQIPIILFQNKVDLMPFLKDHQNTIKEDSLIEFHSDPNFIGSVETSAKENCNIKEGILRLVEEIIKRREDNNDNGEENDDFWLGSNSDNHKGRKSLRSQMDMGDNRDKYCLKC